MVRRELCRVRTHPLRSLIGSRREGATSFKDSAISLRKWLCPIFPLQQLLPLCRRRQDHPLRTALSFSFCTSHPLLSTQLFSKPSVFVSLCFLILLFARQSTRLITLGRIPADAHTKGVGRATTSCLPGHPHPCWRQHTRSNTLLVSSSATAHKTLHKRASISNAVTGKERELHR